MEKIGNENRRYDHFYKEISSVMKELDHEYGSEKKNSVRILYKGLNTGLYVKVSDEFIESCAKKDRDELKETDKFSPLAISRLERQVWVDNDRHIRVGEKLM